MIAEGEHEHQDFKFAINDARKIARSLSAFANRSGGRLLVGVKDNGNIAGVRSEEDACMVELAAESYCMPPQQVSIKAYNDRNGHTVFVAEIAESASKPVTVAEEEGRFVAYLRVADENVVAHPWLVEAWKVREAASAEGCAPLLGDTERRLMALVASAGGIAPEDAPRAMRCSQLRAMRAAVNLIAAGLLAMERRHSGFILTEPVYSDETPTT